MVLIALTMGEPAGISGEITLKSWLKLRNQYKSFSFFSICDPDYLRNSAKKLGIKDRVVIIDKPSSALQFFGKHLPVIPISLKERVVPGKINPANTISAINSLDQAFELVLQKEADAIVTNPLNKKSLYDVGFKYPGHTEFIAAKCSKNKKKLLKPTMLIISPKISVAPVTIHLPLAKAIKAVSKNLIISTVRNAIDFLKNSFGIKKPKIAIAGINPHAGENGNIGNEEKKIIIPAIKDLKKLQSHVDGPFASDSLFSKRNLNYYNLFVCMYHDQALIPIKTLDFDNGVNVTAGLPIIRTSPDHGTALDIAGKNVANESSLVNAIKIAAKIAILRRKKN